MDESGLEADLTVWNLKKLQRKKERSHAVCLGVLGIALADACNREEVGSLLGDW